jgi:uncharacterized repeat protein (TIGR02543 family)
MKTAKRSISVILSLCFILSITMIFSSAASQIEHTGTLDFSSTSADAGDLDTDGYHWDNATQTLTIKNIRITVSKSGYTTGIDLPDGAKLVVEGTNTINCTYTGTDTSEWCDGIYSDGNINVSGTGTVDFVLSGNCEWDAIYTDEEKISIDGTGMTCTFSNTENSMMFYSDESVNIKNASVTCNGPVVVTESEGSASTIENSTIKCTSLSLENIPLYFNDALTVINSTIDVTTNTYRTLVSENNGITITGSTLNLTNTYSSDGLKDPATMNDLTKGNALIAMNGDLKITDSSVKVSAPLTGILAIGNYDNTASKYVGGNISITNSDVVSDVTLANGTAIGTIISKADTNGLGVDMTADAASMSPITLTNDKELNSLAISKQLVSGKDAAPIFGITSTNTTPYMLVTSFLKAGSTSYTFGQTSAIGGINGAATSVKIAPATADSRIVLNGGAFIGTAPVLVAGDDILTTLGTPVKANNTFAGWFYDAACTKPVKAGDKYARGMVLYAKWTANTSTNTVNTGDNTAIGAAAAMTLASIAGIAFVSKKKGE